MPSHRSIQIAKAIAKTNPKAAREYLEYAYVREEIDKQLVNFVSDEKVEHEQVRSGSKTSVA